MNTAERTKIDTLVILGDTMRMAAKLAAMTGEPADLALEVASTKKFVAAAHELAVGE